ncbi:AAA family ATPase [Methanobacterium sp. ACI-7]|uniref:AAA family ATPase n=1 Tax=unclassified Methanobacterium TaxID=2627676 RepID=UPI0039C3C7A0
MELPWNIAVVTGVPGVGKTSLCRKVSEELGYNYVNYGDLMLSIAESMDLASTDIQMFSLDIEIQYKIWKNAALKIKDVENVLVDLHGVDQSYIGYIISLPVEIFQPDIIVIIEAKKENILLRRNMDTKERIIDTYKSLNEHMEILKTTMASCSAILGCNLAILENNDFQKCLNDLKNILNIIN